MQQMPSYMPQAPSMWAQPGSQQPSGPHFEAELEINDFPQHARWKVRCCLSQSAFFCPNVFLQVADWACVPLLP